MEEMQETTLTETTEQETPPTGAPSEEALQAAPPGRRDIGKTVAIASVAGACVILVAALLYGLVTHPVVTTILRDISIIVLALVTMVTGVFLAILIMQIQSLIVLLRDEIYPILNSVNDTANTVRGTTTFVSDAVVSPVISAASYISAIRQTLKLLVGGSSRPKQPPQAPTE